MHNAVPAGGSRAGKPGWLPCRRWAGSRVVWRGAATLWLLLTLCVPRTRAAHPSVLDAAVGQLLWTSAWYVPARATPSGTLLTQLDIDQQVRAAGIAQQVGPTAWVQVWLWGTQRAWMPAGDLATAPVPLRPASGGPSSRPHPIGPHAPLALHATGLAERLSNIRALPGATGRILGQLPAGASLAVRGWATDSAGYAWYGLSAPLPGWISADQVHLTPVAGAASLAPLDGVGMWITRWVLPVTSPYALVAAARRHHVTHLYAEVGPDSMATLAVLLPLAHRDHIAVIAWVYSYLNNLPRDVAAALDAAQYVAPSGDRVDGLLADVEENMAEPFVRAYGEILRATLGPTYLMGVATYPPQTSWGKRYPYSTVARSWDYLAPMDYWHIAYGSSSTPAAAYRYVATSIVEIRQRAHRPDLPIEAIGQMYDPYQDGRHSPSGAEIRAAMQAAADHDAGVSFFEWNHATPDEWDALLAQPGQR